jgi:hypothetical protein
MPQHRILVGSLGLVMAACRVYGVPTAPAAAIFAGSAVGASVLHREVTGDCLALCSPGWQCDRDSGLCVESERSGDLVRHRPDAGLEHDDCHVSDGGESLDGGVDCTDGDAVVGP